jgi:hypothetical protein
MPPVSCMAYSSSQKMEAGSYSETFVDIPGYVGLISIKLILILFVVYSMMLLVSQIV